MHTTKIDIWQHDHLFNENKTGAEKKTFIIIIITVIVMIIEIAAGWIFKSMALFSDGWHMFTHAGALSITLISYILARKLINDKKFAFGTWKIEILGAYTSAILLGVVGLFVLYMSVERILNPVPISYTGALIVAVVGLIVNLVCAGIIHSSHHHNHDPHIASENHNHGLHHHPNKSLSHPHDETHDHQHQHNEPHEHPHPHPHPHKDHQDLNLKAAYLHVIADALTSVMAIIALLGARYFNLVLLDPLMGIVSSILIFRWTYFLLKDTSSILLDREMDSGLISQIKNIIESDNDSKISDLHLWRVSQTKYACIVSLVAKNPLSTEEYRNKLKSVSELRHITIEISYCR